MRSIIECSLPLFINPDLKKIKNKTKKYIVGRNRTTGNAIVRVSIYHRLYNDGTVRKRRRVLLRSVGVGGRKKLRRSRPRLELSTLPEKAFSADLDGGATCVSFTQQLLEK